MKRESGKERGCGHKVRLPNEAGCLGRARRQSRERSIGQGKIGGKAGPALLSSLLLLAIALSYPLAAYSEEERQDELNRELIDASGKGLYDHVELLLEAGAEVNAKLGSNKTALALAVDGEHTDIVELLLESGADTNIRYNANTFKRGTVLMRAAKNGNVGITELLLERGAQVNAKNSKGTTPLIIAAANGHYRIADMLLEEEADPNLQDRYGYTALHLAAGNGYLEIVELLLEEGADPTLKNRSGNTAIDVPWEKMRDKRRAVRERGRYSEITEILKEAWEEQIEIKKEEAARSAKKRAAERRAAEEREKEKESSEEKNREEG